MIIDEKMKRSHLKGGRRNESNESNWVSIGIEMREILKKEHRDHKRETPSNIVDHKLKILLLLLI